MSHLLAAILLVALLISIAAVVKPFRPFENRKWAAGATLLTWLLFPLAIAPRADDPPASRSTAAPAQSVVTGAFETRVHRAPPAPPTDIWKAKANTLACSSIRSVETVLFLDALGASKGVRNPQSDSSKTDCESIRRGTAIGVYSWSAAEGVADVHIPGKGRRYMPETDIAAATR